MLGGKCLKHLFLIGKNVGKYTAALWSFVLRTEEIGVPLFPDKPAGGSLELRGYNPKSWKRARGNNRTSTLSSVRCCKRPKRQ